MVYASRSHGAFQFTSTCYRSFLPRFPSHQSVRQQQEQASVSPQLLLLCPVGVASRTPASRPNRDNTHIISLCPIGEHNTYHCTIESSENAAVPPLPTTLRSALPQPNDDDPWTPLSSLSPHQSSTLWALAASPPSAAWLTPSSSA